LEVKVALLSRGGDFNYKNKTAFKGLSDLKAGQDQQERRYENSVEVKRQVERIGRKWTD
jgi:hypothetical protein